jgi:lysozyme
MKRVTGAAGLAMVKGREGLRLFAYPDPDSDLAQATPHLRKRWGFENAVTLLATLPAETQKLSGAPWTIGYGHTGDVEPGQQITEHQADVVLASDLGWAEDCINLRAPNIGQNQFDALVDLVINIGCPAFDTSTLLRLVRKGDSTPSPAIACTELRERAVHPLESRQRQGRPGAHRATHRRSEALPHAGSAAGFFER